MLCRVMRAICLLGRGEVGARLGMSRVRLHWYGRRPKGAHAARGQRLVDYRATAHGYDISGAAWRGFREPPQVVKSRRVALEVYWRAPSLSKQFIRGAA